ncbi:unannotated protein [freshwater metagenome]|uniref:Unannotated protein n=1 Tax=freshwater metagenome TaxID=449393 RepID=A0A6J6TY55_9ZZZZ
MTGSTSRMQRKLPVKVTLRELSHMDKVVWSKSSDSWVIALFTKTSMRPKSFATWAKVEITSFSTPKST